MEFAREVAFTSSCRRMSTWLWRLVVIVAASGEYWRYDSENPWNHKDRWWPVYYAADRHAYYFNRSFQWDYEKPTDQFYGYEWEFDDYYSVSSTASATTAATTSTTDAATTDSSPTVRGTMSMSCSPADKEHICSDANLAVDGTTHAALFAALSASEVDTTDATIGALSCRGRRLPEASERRLEDVNFTLSYAASFAECLAAAVFFVDVAMESSVVADAFEDQLFSNLGVDVAVTLHKPKVSGITETARAAHTTMCVFSIFVSLAAPMLVLGL